MAERIDKVSSELEPFRFGSIAVFRGYVDLPQIQQALAEQIEDNVHERPHRPLGKILRERGWLSEEQERSILREMFRDAE